MFWIFLFQYFCNVWMLPYKIFLSMNQTNQCLFFILWYPWLCIKSIIKSLILHMYLLFLFGFFIIIDVLFSNEVSFNFSIGFWSLNELFQKIQRRNSEQRIEEKFSWRLKQILVQISAPNLPQKSILFQF